MSYRGYEVLPVESNQRDGQMFTANRFERAFQNPVGRDLLINVGYNEWSHRQMFTLQWFMSGRVAIDEFLDFIENDAEGQKNPFWVSTKASDVVLADAGLFAGDTMDFWDEGQFEFHGLGPHRQHFELARVLNPTTGTNHGFLYGKMSFPTIPSANKVRATISVEDPLSPAALIDWGPQHMAVVGATRFSRLFLMRLADANVSLRWHGRDLAESTLELIEVPSLEYP